MLPPQVYILGCQPAAYDDFELGLSPEVQAAIPQAVARLLAWIARAGEPDKIEKESA